jgi:O-antigen ligase
MRNLLALTICVLAIVVTFALDFSFGAGMTPKNLIIYFAAGVLILQTILGQPLKGEVQGLNLCFGVLIAYALLSTFVAADIIEYKGYTVLSNIIYLKGILFDWWVLFAIFYYGARSVEDVEKLIKVLLIAVSIANLATIGQLSGFIHLGRDVVGEKPDEDRRIFGVFGHANETGTLIACLIPAYMAVADSAFGMRRWLWIGAMMTSVTVMILTASRGALAGLIIGGFWGILLCRRYLSLERALKWLSVTVAVLIPMVIVVGIKYWDLLLGRFTEANHGGELGSVRELSSGRTDIWTGGLARMMEQPWSFITGLGWNSWSVMGFVYIPHNEYLSLWFELGLVGVICFILIMRKTVVMALAAAAIADSRARGYLVACVFSILILAVSVIFAILFVPWYFIWPYVGLSLRYASIVMERNRRELAQGKPLEVAPATVMKAKPRNRAGVSAALQKRPIGGR